MRETLFLLYDSSLNDGFSGRRFPVVWRRCPGTTRGYVSVAKAITQIFSSDPRAPGLEFVTMEHGLAHGDDIADLKFPRLQFETDAVEREHRQIVTPMVFHPRNANQWLLLTYMKNDTRGIRPRQWPWFWEFSQTHDDHLTVKANAAGDLLNRGVDTNNVVFVESRNGFAAATDQREIEWMDMVHFAVKHSERASGIPRDLINAYVKTL